LALLLASLLLSAGYVIKVVALRREYTRRLSGVPPIERNLEFSAVDPEEVAWSLTELQVRGYPSRSQFQEMEESSRLIYAASLEGKVRTSGLWATTFATVSTIVVSIGATLLVGRISEGSPLSATEIATNVLVGAVLAAFAMVPGFSAVIATNQRRRWESLLESYRSSGRGGQP